MFIVYVLRSEKDNKLYKGCTSDLSKRIAEHNGGKVRSTCSRIPFKIIYTEEFITLSEARKREYHFKSAKGARELKKLLDRGVEQPGSSSGS